MSEEMRGEAMDAVVTAVEKFADNMEVRRCRGTKGSWPIRSHMGADQSVVDR
jgi:hypothetical protein